VGAFRWRCRLSRKPLYAEIKGKKTEVGGWCSTLYQRIAVRTDRKVGQDVTYALVHEVAHAINDKLGIDDEGAAHDVLVALVGEWLAFMRANPIFVRRVLEGIGILDEIRR
jgi:hypothetical protein